MIRGIHHVSLATTDIDRFLKFYGDLMGAKVRGVFPLKPGANKPLETVVGMDDIEGDAAGLSVANMKIEVFCYRSPKPRPGERRPACDVGIRHICFDVKDIFGEYERLKAAGVDFISPPQPLEGVGCISCYLYDPDGNIVELQEILPGSIVQPAFGLEAAEPA
jgi:catechol 2,3-dioxygenase-like lactoylglutathione lyase family enzyme